MAMRREILLAVIIKLAPVMIFAEELVVTESKAEEEQLTIAKIVTERKRGTFGESGSNVHVIDSEKLESLGFSFLTDAVASVPGVTVNQNGAYGGVASVRIRGASSSHTLVLVDGVPVNDPSTPDGSFDFSRLSSSETAKIEVLRGSHSIVWGTNAIGGVIAITTKSPEKGFSSEVFGEVGAFNTGRGGVAFAFSDVKHITRVALSNVSSSGISKADKNNGNLEDDAYEATNFAGATTISLPTSGKISAKINWTSSNTEYDVFSFNGQGFVGDGDELGKTMEWSASLKIDELEVGEYLSNSITLATANIDRNNFSSGKQSFGADGKRIIARYLGNYITNSNNTFRFGVESEQTESGTDSATLNSQFVLWEYEPTENLWISTGVRNAQSDEFGSLVVAKFAAFYAISENLQFNFGWGQGFKIPSIFQTTFYCCGAVRPNQELSPEESEAIDFKMDWQSSNRRFSLGIGLFDQEIDNMIDYAQGTYYNIAKVQSKGVEVSASLNFKDGFQISANYTLIDAVDANGKKLSRIPRHSGDVHFTFKVSEQLSGNLLVRYNGDELNMDMTTLDQWHRLDFNGIYKVDENSELYVRVENLLNKDYQQILGYGTPGFSMLSGFRLKY